MSAALTSEVLAAKTAAASLTDSLRRFMEELHAVGSTERCEVFSELIRAFLDASDGFPLSSIFEGDDTGTAELSFARAVFGERPCLREDIGVSVTALGIGSAFLHALETAGDESGTIEAFFCLAAVIGTQWASGLQAVEARESAE